jgi:hypothetical protein
MWFEGHCATATHLSLMSPNPSLTGTQAPRATFGGCVFLGHWSAQGKSVQPGHSHTATMRLLLPACPVDLGTQVMRDPGAAAWPTLVRGCLGMLVLPAPFCPAPALNT